MTIRTPQVPGTRARIILVGAASALASLPGCQDAPPPEPAPSASVAEVAAEPAPSAEPVASADAPAPSASSDRFAVKGPSDNPDPHIARQAALREAAEFGMIGLLNSGAGGDPDAPTAPFGRDDALSKDSLTPRGNLWGDKIGDAFGAGGLGLQGIGEGGAGRGEGIGLGTIGSIGHGAGTGTGQGFGGNGNGRLSGSARSKPPSVRMGATEVTGSLPKEVVQRIVRQNFGRFRLCYENGLRNDPTLAGKVTVSFTIGTDGSVSTVSQTTDLKDTAVATCVSKAFYGLSFPQPDKGTVKVSYPISFAPGEPAAESKDGKASTPAAPQPAEPAVAEPTIGGTALSKVTPADVERVLKEAGFSDVTTTEKPGQKGVFSISGKKGQEQYMLTLVTAASGAKLEDAEKTRLLKEAATTSRGGFFLAVESSDNAKSKALLDALIKQPA